MTALRPHSLHEPSLFILLGLYCPLVTKGQKVRVHKKHEDGGVEIKTIRTRSVSLYGLENATKDSAIKIKASKILNSNQLADMRKKEGLKQVAGKGHRAYNDNELSILREKVIELLKEGIFDRKFQYAMILRDEDTTGNHYLPLNEHDEKMAFATFQVYASAARDYFDNPIPSEREQSIIDAYKAGNRLHTITQLLDTSRYIVKYTLKKFGIASRTKWPAKSYRKTIIELAAAGKSAREIMSVVACDTSTVYRVLNQEKNRNGISK